MITITPEIAVLIKQSEDRWRAMDAALLRKLDEPVDDGDEQQEYYLWVRYTRQEIADYVRQHSRAGRDIETAGWAGFDKFLAKLVDIHRGIFRIAGKGDDGRVDFNAYRRAVVRSAMRDAVKRAGPARGLESWDDCRASIRRWRDEGLAEQYRAGLQTVWLNFAVALAANGDGLDREIINTICKSVDKTGRGLSSREIAFRVGADHATVSRRLTKMREWMRQQD